MPFVRRALLMLGLVVAVLGGSSAIAGCGPKHEATGFCAAIRRGHSAFDSTDQAHAAKALAEFDRVAASAPAAVAPDVKTVASVIRDPRQLVHDPALTQRYLAAIARIDRYLQATCGVSVPPTAKLF